MFDPGPACVAADALAAKINADVLIFNGSIDTYSSRKFVDIINGRPRRKKLFFILVTPGGDPDAAFKIGRAMQAKYDEVQAFIPGWCKSAGTLITLAANHIFIGDQGELGPLDIQIAKSDEIMEMGSGLTVDAAMKSLEISASKMFLNLLLTIRRDTGGTITTRTAAELASSMVVKLLDPIFRQIDPMKIGENSRAMNITKAYGTRLNMKSQILRSQRSLDFLVSAYPDHGFVIDRSEAVGLFAHVSGPTDEMVALATALKEAAISPQLKLSADGGAYVSFLSSQVKAAQKDVSRAPNRAAASVPKRPAKAKSRTNGHAPNAIRSRARKSASDASSGQDAT